MVYLNQTKLRIVMSTGQDLSNAKIMKIKYRKPKGSEGSWDASALNVKGGVFYYDIPPVSLNQPSVIDEVGTWTVWSWVQFNDDRVLPGDPTPMVVYPEGSSEVRK